MMKRKKRRKGGKQWTLHFLSRQYINPRQGKCWWRRSAHKERKERLALTQGVASKRAG